MRDLILNRTPKDFDIITSAELKEVFPSVIIIFFFLDKLWITRVMLKFNTSSFGLLLVSLCINASEMLLMNLLVMFLINSISLTLNNYQ